MTYKIKTELCLDCGACERVCDNDCIRFIGSNYEIDSENCDECGKCYDACLIEAIVPI